MEHLPIITNFFLCRIARNRLFVYVCVSFQQSIYFVRKLFDQKCIYLFMMHALF